MGNGNNQMIGETAPQASSSIKISERFAVLQHAFLFVLGFSVVFVVGWGGAVTALGQLFGAYKYILGRVGGVVVILFGLATLDVVHIPWFYADTRLHYQGRAGTFANSALMGLLFAAGWSPCIGATLGAILTMGLSQSTVGQAMWLASGYSLGLGIPFLILALGLERATGMIRRLRRYQRLFQIASGIFIIAIGFLLVANLMSRIAIWAFQNNFYFDAGLRYSAAPTYLTAVVAGLLSFLSPCVLPLVPAYLGYMSGHTFRGA
jgi:cytochrome c-type biogenesis protein